MESLSQSGAARGTQAGWQFWIDRGGTFTDVVGLAPDGALHVRKVLSASAGGAAAGDPGLAAARAIAAAVAPHAPVIEVKVGTTVATNALLTRMGEPVVLVTTAGFADALRVGYQNRPDIFARNIVLPKLLHAAVIEAAERIDADGRVLAALDEGRLRAELARARQHELGHVDAENPAARHYTPGECNRCRAPATTDVDHEVAGARCGARQQQLGHGCKQRILLLLAAHPALSGGAVPVGDLLGVAVVGGGERHGNPHRRYRHFP